MLKKTENIQFIFNKNNNINIHLKKKIEKYWEHFSQKKPDLFNGNVLLVNNIKKSYKNFTINITIGNFAEIIYAKLVRKIKRRGLFSGGYIITSDDYICFVKDNNNSINLVGGMATDEDLENNKYNPEQCLIREIKEELGIDIRNKYFKYRLKYLRYPTGFERFKKHYSVGLIYEIKTKYKKQDIRDLFNNKKHDKEIKSLIFLKKDQFKNLKKYKKRKYIYNLSKLIYKEYR